MQRFVARADFDDGKFSMKTGDLVTCEQRHAGWCGGTNLRTGLRGWYPESYVQPELTPPPTAAPPLAPQQVPMANAVPQEASVLPRSQQHHRQYPVAQVMPASATVMHPQQSNNSSKSGAYPAPKMGGSSRGLIHDAAPAWASQQPQQQHTQSSLKVGDEVKKIGQWFQQGLGNSTVGNTSTPTQRVYNSSRISTGSGGFFSGQRHTTTAVQEVPSQTGAGRLAKRVGDGAVLSAVWGATTMHPGQMMKAAAVAATAYAVEGNERTRARQQQDEFLRQQEEQHRREQEERRKNSWLKW